MNDIGHILLYFVAGSICAWISTYMHYKHVLKAYKRERLHNLIIKEKAENILENLEDYITLYAVDILKIVNDLTISELLARVKGKSPENYTNQNIAEAIEKNIKEMEEYASRQEQTERTDER